MKQTQTVALYGNVSLERGYCKDCEGTTIIKNGRYMCCGEHPGIAEIFKQAFKK